MNKKLAVFVCHNLAPEVSHVLSSEEFPDVELFTYPSSCIGSPLNDERILELTRPVVETHSKILVIVSTCRKISNEELLLNQNIQIIRLEKCMDLFVNKELIDYYIKEGCYLVSNGWLKNYRYHIKSWGFPGEEAPAFFRESIKKVLQLDTGINRNDTTSLQNLAEYMGLPYEILPIGLSYCRKLIEGEVLRWRFDCEHLELSKSLSKLNRDIADYLFIFKQLEVLAGLNDEENLISEVFKLINHLYAPRHMAFFSKCSESTQEVFWFNGLIRPTVLIGENDLEFEIQDNQQCIGIFKIYEVQFPEFKAKYIKMLPILSRVCGITLSNARRYRVIQNQKEQLQTTTELLDESLKTKDRFFSIISHDLRSPFNAIYGFSEFLKESLERKDYENAIEYADIIKNSSERSMNLLSNLIEWSRSETGRIEYKPVQLKLSTLLDDVVSLLNPAAAQKSIQLRCETPADLTVFADAAMLNTVVRNLISNAIKFTRPEGVIFVNAVKKGDDCVVSVRDSGIGIEPSNIQKLFSVVGGHTTTGTNNEKGTGLGLILCKDFVERNGGKIWVESEWGKGSVFYFTVKPPAVED